MKELARILLLKPLYNLLIFFAAVVPGHSIGWAIILLTVLVRIILLIPTRKSLMAQRKLQELGPHMEAIKQQYKGDSQAQAKATMELYKEHGVSPVSSCLPALVQLPVLFILYYVFRISLNTDRFDLLYGFTPHPDVINTYFFGIDLAKPDLWVLPVLAAAAQFVASWQLKPKNKAKSDDIAANLTSQMLYIFPVMTFIIGRSLPAALSLYWVATTLFSVAQQYFLFRNVKVVKDIKTEVAHELKAERALPAKRGVEVVVRKRK